jgi:hypothetical protein
MKDNFVHSLVHSVHTQPSLLSPCRNPLALMGCSMYILICVRELCRRCSGVHLAAAMGKGDRDGRCLAATVSIARI